MNLKSRSAHASSKMSSNIGRWLFHPVARDDALDFVAIAEGDLVAGGIDGKLLREILRVAAQVDGEQGLAFLLRLMSFR